MRYTALMISIALLAVGLSAEQFPVLVAAWAIGLPALCLIVFDPWRQ